jgi:hypothetical protein
VPADTRKATFAAIEEWLGRDDPDQREADYLLAYLEARRPLNEAVLLTVSVLTGMLVSLFILVIALSVEQDLPSFFLWFLAAFQFACLVGFAFGLWFCERQVAEAREIARLIIRIRANVLRAAERRSRQPWWRRLRPSA